jgi:hypothetical protein
MASLPDRVVAVAQALIASVGMTHAVATTDIAKQAEALHRQYAEYSKVEIQEKISNQIKKTHQPGVSG